MLFLLLITVLLKKNGANTIATLNLLAIKKTDFIRGLLSLVILPIFLTACNNGPSSENESQVANEIERDENAITFVTLNSPNTFYINSDKQNAGLEYDLAKEFARFTETDKEVRFVVAESIEEVIATIISGKADIAASDLTLTDSRNELINFSVPYQDIQQQVVYNKKETRRPAKSVGGLVNKQTVVPTASSFVERLSKYKNKLPELNWTARNNIDSEGLLEEVAAGKIQYTVADSHLVSVLQNYFPDLRVAFPLGKPEKIAWGFSKEGDPALLLSANAFFTHIRNNGTLRNIVDRYHGNSKRLKPIDINTFMARSETRLPKYKALFKQAQETTDLDWRLIAALSYQESHWDTFSTSPTNVRGLMMLTEITSVRMGIQNRLDPKQSVPAGAKYLKLMIKKFPERIPEPDRTFLALAAYNAGFAHVEDARILAQRLGLNPDSWVDVKKAMVKLKNPKHYAKAKYGYCRCGQAVIYVESIRSYYNIMSRFESAHQPDATAPYKVASN